MGQPGPLNISDLYLIDSGRDDPHTRFCHTCIENFSKFLSADLFIAEQIHHLIQQSDQNSVHLAVLTCLFPRTLRKQLILPVF